MTKVRKLFCTTNFFAYLIIYMVTDLSSRYNERGGSGVLLSLFSGLVYLLEYYLQRVAEVV